MVKVLYKVVTAVAVESTVGSSETGNSVVGAVAWEEVVRVVVVEEEETDWVEAVVVVELEVVKMGEEENMAVREDWVEVG